MSRELKLTLTESVTVQRSTPELLEVEASWGPATDPPPKHLHPNQEEHFEVRSGRLQVRAAGRDRILGPGETIDMPRGTVHQMWNPDSGSPTRALWQTRPGGRTEQWFEGIDRLYRSGRVGRNGMPGPLAFAVMLNEYRDVFRLAARPAPLVRAVLALLAPIGRLRGYRATSSLVVVALVAAGLALTAAAPASARSFGANLSRSVNAAFGCETLPSTDAFGGRVFLPSNATTCTYVGTGSQFGSREVPGTPVAGVVTRVRVKAGPRTGPMQITVLRATRSAIGFACCFYVRASRVFTPRPNGTTTLNVNLPVRLDLNPSFGETRDYLGLTVLEPGVPVPANDTGAPGAAEGPGALGFFPHVKRGDERADGAGIGGVTPLIRGTVRPKRRG